MIPNRFVQDALDVVEAQLVEAERRTDTLRKIKAHMLAAAEPDMVTTHAACFCAGMPGCADEPPGTELEP